MSGNLALSQRKRIGIPLRAGDVPGLNFMIKSVVYRGTELGWEVIGIRRVGRIDARRSECDHANVRNAIPANELTAAVHHAASLPNLRNIHSRIRPAYSSLGDPEPLIQWHQILKSH
jgi:hypothetical protein